MIYIYIWIYIAVSTQVDQPSSSGLNGGRIRSWRSWHVLTHPMGYLYPRQLRHPWASESGSPRDCCPNVHPQHNLQRCDSQPLRGTSPRPGSAVGTGNFSKMSHSHQESNCGINSVNSDKLENLEMLTTPTTLVSQQVGWSCAKSVDVPRTHHD